MFPRREADRSPEGVQGARGPWGSAVPPARRTSGRPFQRRCAWYHPSVTSWRMSCRIPKTTAHSPQRSWWVMLLVANVWPHPENHRWLRQCVVEYPNPNPDPEPTLKSNFNPYPNFTLPSWRMCGCIPKTAFVGCVDFFCRLLALLFLLESSMWVFKKPMRGWSDFFTSSQHLCKWFFSFNVVLHWILCTCYFPIWMKTAVRCCHIFTII